MMWGIMLTLSLIFTDVMETTRFSPPGKPKLTACRSPEKETFTCWWEPGQDGGLPTTHSLYYRKESSDAVYECPDYRTAGENSCFFNKNDTSIWVNYNITVVATNALGHAVSDPVDVDVVYIVQPHMPENVTAVVQEVEGNDPSLLVRWEPPRKADTRSGWITLVYELRVRLVKGEKWEEHFAGQQKQFNIFSPHSGEVYVVQVRCKPDHGFWSEWSSTAYVTVPDYIQRERSQWILIVVMSAFAFVIITWTLNVNHISVKHFLLPPVPGPKIKGFDTQLLKGGTSEDILDHFGVMGFPPTLDYEDLLVEHFEVYDAEQESVLEGKDLQEGHLKAPSDSDSGRGSCDSHTLLMEKCGEPKVDQTAVPKGEQSRSLVRSNSHAGRMDSAQPAGDTNRSWPTVFSENHIHKPPYHSIAEISRQCHSPGNHCPPSHQKDYEEKLTGGTRLGKHPGGSRRVPNDSECNVPAIGHKGEAIFQPSKAMEYVEVQNVERENMLTLKPIAKEVKDQFTGQDYSKVNGVVNDSILLLQREMAADDHELKNAVENCAQQQAGKPPGHIAAPLPYEGAHIASTGYVDTAAILPTFSQPTQRESP
ncbi:prolactin receptor a [Conger conger]|uniref:prolactin receptor a n=1 Tax=Conger conger TaxID=82655 RepID=UPI002A59EF32|nr:prolactin receptor a [Conger conger]